MNTGRMIDPETKCSIRLRPNFRTPEAMGLSGVASTEVTTDCIRLNDDANSFTCHPKGWENDVFYTCATLVLSK